jgi:hypothetical protein
MAMDYVVVPELSCTICHVNSVQIAQASSGTTIFIAKSIELSEKKLMNSNAQPLRAHPYTRCCHFALNHLS